MATRQWHPADSHAAGFTFSTRSPGADADQRCFDRPQAHSCLTSPGTLAQVLGTLETFDTNLEEYLHLVIPAVVRLTEAHDAPLDLRKAQPHPGVP